MDPTPQRRVATAGDSVALQPATRTLGWRGAGVFGLDPAVLRDACAIFVLSRLGLVALTAAVLRVAIHAPLSFSAFVAAWSHWDTNFYVVIAANGYSRQFIDRTAFFPLQPLVMHLVAPAVGGNLYVAGMVTANVCCFFALLGIGVLASGEGNAATARRAMLYLALFPSAFFLFAGYTESLFLALAIWCVVAARRGWWWQAGALGLLAALTRQAGLLLLAPFLYEYGARCGWQLRKVRPDVLFGLLIPTGLLLFMGYLWRTVGDPLSFAHVERLWHRTPTLPPVTLVWGVLALPQQPDRILLIRGAVDLLMVLVILGTLIWGIRRMRPGDWLYSAGVWVMALSLPVAAWPLVSDARYMLGAFPCLLLWARVERHPWLRALALGTFATLLLVLAQYYLRGRVII